MLIVTPSATAYLEGLVRQSQVSDPVINIVARSESFALTPEIEATIQSGDKAKLRRLLGHRVQGRTTVVAAIFHRREFSPGKLVSVNGLTFVLPLYVRLLFVLRLDVVGGELTFTDRKGRPVLPPFVT